MDNCTFKLYVNGDEVCSTNSPALAVVFLRALYNYYPVGVIRLASFDREEVAS